MLNLSELNLKNEVKQPSEQRKHFAFWSMAKAIIMWALKSDNTNTRYYATHEQNTVYSSAFMTRANLIITFASNHSMSVYMSGLLRPMNEL